jgi:hypothetical protein
LTSNHHEGDTEPSVLQAVRAEYLDSIRRWSTGGGYRLPGEFVIGVGTRQHGDGQMPTS